MGRIEGGDLGEKEIDEGLETKGGILGFFEERARERGRAEVKMRGIAPWLAEKAIEPEGLESESFLVRVCDAVRLPQTVVLLSSVEDGEPSVLFAWSGAVSGSTEIVDCRVACDGRSQLRGPLGFG
ncbi:uncharacterized protein A4U43_C10F6830 [Asparagus officinalis]|uniref:Uncharacterized protein n=1 Tax=Asparagus officinalis TaxID=4686 RepID=A0A5P1E2Z0_ASPOF|nr:uncharacterized protein A4U43_C10F6830 [Asparagus officinalis]